MNLLAKYYDYIVKNRNNEERSKLDIDLQSIFMDDYFNEEMILEFLNFAKNIKSINASMLLVLINIITNPTLKYEYALMGCDVYIQFEGIENLKGIINCIDDKYGNIKKIKEKYKLNENDKQTK